MTFDINKFDKAQFKDRTFDVKVPELKAFYGEDEEPLWVCKCLDGEELAKVNEAISANRDMGAVIGALNSNVSKEKLEAVKELMGIQSDAVPKEIVRRVALLTYGSVSPVCTQMMAVKLASSHPTTLYKITNKIIELTGMGKVGE